MSKSQKKKNPKQRKRIAAILKKTIPNQIRNARNYPIEACYFDSTGLEQGLVTTVIVRKKSDFTYLLGTYLVDIFCLGLKNTLYQKDIAADQIDDAVERMSCNKLIQCDSDTAHTFIYGGIDYAEKLGFQPHSDFQITRFILAEREDIQFDTAFEFGKDGKPFFIAGPSDSQSKIQAILAQLDQVVGPDNYEMIIPMGETDEFYDS